MGVVNTEEGMFWATGIDTTGLAVDGKKMQQIFSEITDGAGRSVDKMKQNLDESIRVQQAVIGRLEQELLSLEDAYSKSGKSGYHTPEYIEQRKKEAQAIAEVRAELEGEKQDLIDRQKVYDLLDKKMVSLRTQYNNLTNEMARMRANGMAETEQYKVMEIEASKLAKTLQIMNVERQAMAKGGNMQGLLSGLGALSGLMSAGAGAMGLLNEKSEDYAKIQAKVQSMIAITIGLQQVQKTLYETSAFRVQAVTKAKQLWNVATQNLTRSQMVLMGVMTGGLLVAIGLVIAAVEKLVAKEKERREEAKKLNDAIASNSASQIANYEKLRRSYNLLGDDIKAKEKFILDNQSAFDGLGVSIHNVNEADNVFINNTQAFKTAIMERAKAAAAMELASEKYKEALTKIGQANQMKDTKTRLDSAEGTGITYEVENKAKTKLLNEAKKAEDEANTYIQMNISHTAKAGEKMMEAGIQSANNITLGSKAHWEAVKKFNQDRLNAMKTTEKGSKEWNETVAKIKHADKMISSFDVSGRNKNNSSNLPEDLSIGIKEAQLKLEAERLAIMKDGKDKRLKLSEQEWKEEIARLDKEHAERLKKYKEQDASMPEEEMKIYSDRKEIAGKAKEKRDADIENEFRKELESIYKDLGDVFLSEEERKKKAIKERYEEERRLAKELYEKGGMTDEQHIEVNDKLNAAETEEHRKRMLEGLESFKQQESELTKYWNERISEIENSKSLTETERMEALKQAKKQFNDEVNELNAHALVQSEDWIKLFADTASLTDKEIDNLIKSIKEKINSGEIKLDPIDANNFIRSLEQVRDGMKNPINQIISGFHAWKKAKEDQADAERKLTNWKAIGASNEDIKKATEEVKRFKVEAQEAAAGIADAFGKAKGMIDSIGGDISKVAESFGGDTRQLDNVTNLLGGVATAGQGIAKIASGDIVGGITDAVKGIANVITSINGISDTERQKRIEKLAESIEKSKKKYEELGYAREKAFSTDKAKIVEEQNRLAEQQIKDLDAMIAEEEKKKNSDPEALKQMREEQDRLRNSIRDNKEAAKEAIVGTDIMSAIDQFAQAYADAWAGGEKAAENSAKAIKNIIKGGLMQALKKDISKDAQDVYDAIHNALKNDSRIDDAEQKHIDSLVEAMNKNAEKYRTALEPYLDGDQSGVTGELKKEMTEGTASQLVGLWNITAMDIRAIKEYFERNPINGFEKEVNEILNSLHSIDRNTRDTADNTDGLIDELSEMNDKLDEIKNNTKNNNSRG
ncbi:MAG: hypothetical protein GX102_13700 [Porphyromonadaceae bacterium]|nr:hypothetical protein [Porphyromonadaceae bacterium]